MRESESLATRLLQSFDAKLQLQLEAGIDEVTAKAATIACIAKTLIPDPSSSILFIPNVLQAFNNQINNHLIHDPKHFSMLLDLGRHLLLTYFSNFNEATMNIIGTLLLKIALLVQIIQQQKIDSAEIQAKLFNTQGAALQILSADHIIYNLSAFSSENLIDAFTTADVLIHYLAQLNDVSAEEDWHSWTRIGVVLFENLASRQDMNILCLGKTIYTTWNFFEATRQKAYALKIEEIIRSEIPKIINRFYNAEKLFDADANIHHTNFMHNVQGVIVKFRNAHLLDEPTYTRKDAGLPPKYRLRRRVVPINVGKLPTPIWKQAQEAQVQKEMATTNRIHPPQTLTPF